MARRKIKEGHLGDMAARAEMDHEVQMARSDLYKIAKYAVELHDMLKSVSEAEGMQGWQQSKITKAADYLGSVYHSMDYDTNVEMNESIQLDEMRGFGSLKDLVAAGLRILMGSGRSAAKGANKAIKTVEYRGAVNQAYKLALKVEQEKANNLRTVKKLLKTDKIDIENVERAIDNAISLGRSLDNISGYSTPKLKEMTILIRNDIRLLTKTQNVIGSYHMLQSVIALLALVAIAISYSKQQSGQQVDEDDVEEGNAYAHAVRKAKMDGKKKGDKIPGPNGDITLREHNAPKWSALFGPKIAAMIMGHPDMRKLASPHYKHPGSDQQGYRTSPDERAMPEPELDNPIMRILSKLLANGDITHNEYVQSVDKLESYTGDYEDFEWAGHPESMHEGKKKAKPDYLDFDGDGNKKEPMKKALKDKKKSANESMLRTITQALKYKAGKIGVANISPKAINLAETMITKDLKQLHTDFKKKVVAEGQFGEITHTDEDATQSEVLVKGMGVYRMDQLEQRLKDRLNNVLQLIDRGEPDQAAKLLDPNSSTYKSLMVMMKAYAEAHDELAFGDQSTSAGIGEAKDTHKTKDGRTAKKGLYYYVNKRKKAGTSRSASSSKAPKPKDWKNAAKTAKS